MPLPRTVEHTTSESAFDTLVKQLRSNGGASVHFIATFGRTGTQYAVARLSPKGRPQRRIWSAAGHAWDQNWG